MKAARVFAWLVVVALLAGCATTQPPPPERYTLVATPGAADGHAGAPAAGVLRVNPVLAPAWLRGRGICYRLAYHDAAQVARYGRSVWAAPITQMLGQAVQDALAASGHWRAVIGPGDDARAAISVRIRVLDLCQAFSSQRASAVLLTVRATVTNPVDGRVLAQRRFHYLEPASTPDAPGGVRAARAAVRAFTSDLTRWLARQAVASGAARAAGGRAVPAR